MHGQHTNNVPFVEGSNISYEIVGVGLIKDSFLVGDFPLYAPTITAINMISYTIPQSHESLDPWVVPDLSDIDLLGDTMPLSRAKATYNAIQSVDAHLECDDVHLVTFSPYSLPSWLSSPPPSFDYVSNTFPSDESIIEVMSLDYLPWKDHHHQSSFLPDLAIVENNITSLVHLEIVDMSKSPILTDDVLSEENLGNITLTMFINILENLGVMENIILGQSCSLNEIKAYMALFKEFYDVFTWSYKEMPRIDPSIIVHEIKTYPDIKPIH